MMRLFAISGVKNSGKTTLVTRIIPLLNEKGLKVATIKHDSHSFDPDVPGTDSYKHRHAGAYGTVIFSPERYCLVKETAVTEEYLIEQFSEADIIILEGFKEKAYPKVEIVRNGNSSKSVCDPKYMIGLATDIPEEEQNGFPEGVRILDLNDPQSIADLIFDYYTGKYQL